MSLLGGIFGDSKDADPTRAPNQLADISKMLLDEASPLRRALLNRYTSFLGDNTSGAMPGGGAGGPMLGTGGGGGPFDVTNSPQFGSLKDAINRQFTLAKNNTLATSAPGGSLTSSLSRLEGSRAGAMASGIGNLAENEMSRAFALGTGQTPVGLSGLGMATGQLGNIQAAQAAQQGQALSGIGQGVGYSLGRGKSSGGKGGATTSSAVEGGY